MARTAEFSKDTKREALKRAKGQCEASGPRYGLSPGERCKTSLAHGVIFDHDDPEANSKNASLENCRCICPGRNRRIRTQTMWLVKGVISGSWIEKRIKADNYDAAIAEAHARGMSVREITELKQKQK